MSIFLLFLSLEPRPLVEHAAIASGPSQQRVPTQRASLLYRITPLVSARCPVFTHSFFFFSRTLRRCRSQYLKANGIKERYPQVVYIFFKPHTYSPSLSEKNIHQTTRPRKVARPLSVYSPTRSRYLPKMSCPICLRLCSSPTLPTSRLTA